MSLGTVKIPTIEAFGEVAAELGFTFSPADLTRPISKRLCRLSRLTTGLTKCRTSCRGHYYAKAQNLVRALRRAYDEVLARCDLLLMPTLPIVATPLPEPDAPISQILQHGFEMLANTAQFDCTHHPVMSLSCGKVDGLPVGMMLVAKAFDEEVIYRAAAAFENGVDWQTLEA